MLSPSDPICAVVIAPPRAVQLLSYDRFAQALSACGVQTTIAAEFPAVADDVFFLVHTLAGSADKVRALLEEHPASRIIPLEMMPDGASAAVGSGTPAAILKDGYGRWVNEEASSPDMPSGLVVSSDLARLLEMKAVLGSATVTATDSSHPLPEQLAHVISAFADQQRDKKGP